MCQRLRGVAKEKRVPVLEEEEEEEEEMAVLRGRGRGSRVVEAS